MNIQVIISSEESKTILGILEDIVQEDDFLEAYSFDTRITIYGLIRKFGGRYFGKGYEEANMNKDGND